MPETEDQVPSLVPSSPKEVGRRVRVVADKHGGVPEFAKLTGISESQLYRIVGGESEAKVGTLVTVAHHGKVPVDWLATGSYDATGTSSAPPIAAERRAGYGYANIPLYDVRAKGGAIGELLSEENVVNVLGFREDWIRRELHVAPSDLRLIHVEGDSMEPDLRAGDIILVNHTDTTARREGIYVIRMDDALLVKMLQRLPGGLIKVVSKNPAYEPFTVNAQDVESSADFAIIGRVVWACRRL